jgi:hypothetical protein
VSILSPVSSIIFIFHNRGCPFYDKGLLKGARSARLKMA